MLREQQNLLLPLKQWNIRTTGSFTMEMDLLGQARKLVYGVLVILKDGELYILK
jgi:hypothetical protein